MYSAFFFGLLLAAAPVVAYGAEPEIHEFTDQIERDFHLRSIGQIQFTNLRGNITVLGWSQDRIRVQAKRHVFAENETAAKAHFPAMDFRFQESDGNIECSAEYGRGLNIDQRVQERERPAEFQSKMDMIVYAPSRLKVKLWTAAGNSSLKNWGNSAELRTVSGDVSAENVKGIRITALCQNCSAVLKGIRASIRAITDGGNLAIQDVEGQEVFLESAAGNIQAQKIRGEQQLYVTRSGNIGVKDTRGHVEFQTREGNVEVTGLSGFASGKSESGSIQLRAEQWEFRDKALIESLKGNISLSLPLAFSAEVDLKSNHGTVQSEFPIRRSADENSSPNHLIGRIGEQTAELLKVSSDSGNVSLLKLLH